MQKKDFDIVVIGGGPAGLFSAIFAKTSINTVALIDRKGIVGGKLPVTGNGRCNITNENISYAHYAGENPNFARNVFPQFSNTELIAYFRERGLSMFKESDRWYPSGRGYSGVLDILKTESDRKKIYIERNCSVEQIEKNKNGFSLTMNSKEKIDCRKIIISTGGKSYEKEFGSGGGYVLAEQLGHSIIPLSAGLCSLRLKFPFPSRMSGVSFKADVSLIIDRKKTEEFSGEILITHKGLSGPSILDISNRVSKIIKKSHIELSLNLLPGYDFEMCVKEMEIYAKNFKDRYPVRFYENILPKSVREYLLESTLHIDRSKRIMDLSKKEIAEYASLLTRYILELYPSVSFDEAQVTVGGVNTDEINPKSMESKLVKGVFFAGEVIDIAGDCGGYNLQFAFSTGYIAGINCSAQNKK